MIKISSNDKIPREQPQPGSLAPQTDSRVDSQSDLYFPHRRFLGVMKTRPQTSPISVVPETSNPLRG
jgi:hypothetical protein